MTEATRQRLRAALAGVLLPVHCKGCDAYLCPESEGEGERYLTRVLDAVQGALENKPVAAG